MNFNIVCLVQYDCQERLPGTMCLSRLSAWPTLIVNITVLIQYDCQEGLRDPLRLPTLFSCSTIIAKIVCLAEYDYQDSFPGPIFLSRLFARTTMIVKIVSLVHTPNALQSPLCRWMRKGNPSLGNLFTYLVINKILNFIVSLKL